QECETAKRTLTEQPSVLVRIPNSRGEFADGTTTVTVSRTSFQADMSPLLDRLRGPIHKAMGDGRIAPHQVGDVILVGGATRMPVVGQLVWELFRKEPCCTFNPDEVVALGAAVQAALMADDAAVDDMVMTDVCPHTLGVDVVKQFGQHHE